jgi:putative serine protease PepD
LRGGWCGAHGPAPLSPVSGPGRPAGRPTTSQAHRIFRPALLFTLIVALAATGVVLTARSLEERDRALATERTRTAALGRQLADLDRVLESVAGEQDGLTASIGGLEERVDSIEGDLSSQPDQAEVADDALRSVFTVDTGLALGSAFVVGSGGGGSTLVTNFHVVADLWYAGGRSVAVLQGRARFAGRIVSASAAWDLAAVHVDRTFPVLSLRRTTPEVGEAVLAIGSPYGLGGTVTSGIVSALRDGYVQFSAPIGPGNSGGPIVGLDGSVLGIATLKVVDDAAEGLAFAIDVQTVCSTVVSC